MAVSLSAIAWSDPILPEAPDPAWDAEIRRRGGQAMQADRRIAPCHWLREAGFAITNYQPVAMPRRLFHIGAMVTSHENACRYCYGANRAYMKILGYSEASIQRIEHDVHVAELDDKERAFIQFCRNLARSRPRPSRAAHAAMVALGYSQMAVDEMAFVISMGCFYNRVTTFIACPPEQAFERMANGPLGRVIGLAAPLVRLVTSLRPTRPGPPALDAQALAQARFGPILRPLAGLPAARIMRDALEGAFAPGVLAGGTKALVFAIVARTLGCSHCEGEANQLLRDGGLSQADIDEALATLHTEHIPAQESLLLNWARGTVHYNTAEVQSATRQLGAAIGPSALLEAIGVASLANAVVRLAMLHE